MFLKKNASRISTGPRVPPVLEKNIDSGEHWEPLKVRRRRLAGDVFKTADQEWLAADELALRRQWRSACNLNKRLSSPEKGSLRSRGRNRNSSRKLGRVFG